MTFSTLEHYMTEVVSNIELRFGYPSSQEKEARINENSISLEISVNRMMLIDFEELFDNVLMKKGRENVFELLLFVALGQKVICQKVSRGTYLHNGTIFPKVTIHGDYLDKADSTGRVWLNDETINTVGREFDNYFEYEYVEFLRFKR